MIEMGADLANFRKEMNQAVGVTNRAVNTIKSSLQTVQTAMAGIGVGIGVGEILKIADEYNVLHNRIKTATKETKDYVGASRELLNISQKNGAVLKDTVSVFQGLARSSADLGASNKDIIKLTDTIQKLGVIGGSSSSAMSAGLLQFSQAMAGGVVRAEEFNSILENMPEVANRIAKGMGMTAGQLRLAVNDGKVLSKDVFQSLLKQAPEIEKEFNKIPPSLAQSMTKVQNAFQDAIGSMDQQLHVTQELAVALNWVADNSVHVTNAIMGLAAGSLIVASMRINVVALGSSMVGLFTVIRAHPIGLAVTAIAAMTAALIAAKDHTFKLGNETMKVGTLIRLGWEQAYSGLKNFIELQAMTFKPGVTRNDVVTERLSRELALRERLNKIIQEGKDLQGKVSEAIDANAAAAKRLSKEEERALKRAKKKHESEIGSAKEIVASIQEQILENQKKLAGLEDEIPLLRAIFQLNKLSSLTAKERSDITEELKVKTKELVELEKSIKRSDEIKAERESLKGILEDFKLQNDQLQQKLNKQNELIPLLQAEKRIKDAMKHEDAQASEIAAQIRAEAKRQQELIEQQKKVELQEKLTKEKEREAEIISSTVESVKLENEVLRLKVEGHEELIPLKKIEYDLEKKIKHLTGDKQEAIRKIKEMLEVQDALNKKLKDQKDLIDKIVHSSDSYKTKMDELKRALNQGQINLSQYNQAVNTLQKNQSKAASSAKQFSDIIVNGFSRAIASGKNLGDVFKNIGVELANLVAKKTLIEPLGNLITSGIQRFIGVGNGGGGAPSWLSGLGGLAGGALNWLKGLIPGFASGGWMTGGQVAMVGERGPELVIPQQNSLVLPANLTAALMQASGNNIYGLSNYQSMDQRLLAGAYNGTPWYQASGAQVQHKPEVQRLMAKQARWDALPSHLKHAYSGNPDYYVSNEEKIRAMAASRTMTWQQEQDLKQLMYKQNRARAEALIANSPPGSLNANLGHDILSNNTWSQLSLLYPHSRIALPEGNQLGRILMSAAHRGVIAPGNLMSFANQADAFADIWNPQGVWNMWFSGSGSREGMGGVGSGAYFRGNSGYVFSGDANESWYQGSYAGNPAPIASRLHGPALPPGWKVGPDGRSVPGRVVPGGYSGIGGPARGLLPYQPYGAGNPFADIIPGGIEGLMDSIARDIAQSRMSGPGGTIRENGGQPVRNINWGLPEDAISLTKNPGQYKSDPWKANINSSWYKFSDLTSYASDLSSGTQLGTDGRFKNYPGSNVSSGYRDVFSSGYDPKPAATHLPASPYNMASGFFRGAVEGMLGIKGYATGGRPPLNVPSLVGEQGPELFIPDRSGTVKPISSIAGGGGPVKVSVINQSSGRISQPDVQMKDGHLIVRIKNEIAKTFGTGGEIDRALSGTYGLKPAPVRR